MATKRETDGKDIMDIFERIDAKQTAINTANLFEGYMLEQIRNFYRVSLTWSSNALEGNSLTEIETKVLLEDDLTPHGRPLRDMFEVAGHAEAYDFMFTLRGKRGFAEQDILTLHRLFYRNTDREKAGVYRDQRVLISGSQYPPTCPEDIQRDMDAMLEWADTQRESCHPVEFAASLHKRFVFISPFIDGNGCVSRLLMNTALIQDGYLPAVIPPILRPEYIALLETARTDDRPFIEFIAERELESQENMMRMLHIRPEQGREQAPGLTIQ